MLKMQKKSALIPEPNLEMTMERWKKIHRDFKGRIDGQRTAMVGGKMRSVVIIKPSKTEVSFDSFDEIGSEVDLVSLASFNKLNLTIVQSDPIKALELCLAVMPINEARQLVDSAHFHADDYAKNFTDQNVTDDDILQNFPADTKAKMQVIIDRVKSSPSTDSLYKLPDGTYNSERKEIQDNILFEGVTKDGEFLESIIPNAYTMLKYLPKSGEKPVFIILGGRGGSGKSRFNGMVYNPPPCLVLDADSIKERLPEYEGWNASAVHEESGDMLEQALKKARELGANVVLDATMRTAKSALKNIKYFKDAGYRIEAHYMFLPRQEAAKRAVGRFLNPDSGRFVPIDIVLANTTNEDAFEQVKPLCDSWSFRDNNVPLGVDPILISSTD
jgi:predicted ABC-type ATPase